jgi:hypothetical protein
MVLIKLNILPEIFAKSMWIVQLYTAIIWAVLAIAIQYIKKGFKTTKLNNENI